MTSLPHSDVTQVKRRKHIVLFVFALYIHRKVSLLATPKWEGIADEWTHRNMGAMQRAGGGGEGVTWEQRNAG